MNAVIVIPSRYGSTRFPGKPLVEIAGQTLIQRVYNRALAARRARAVWVATDDDRILEHVTSFGGKAVMTPSELRSGTDRIERALSSIEKEGGHRFEHVVNVQGDEPLIDPAEIDRIIDTLQAEAVDVVTLATPITTDDELRNPDVVKVVCSLTGDALYFSRAPIPHGALAAARRHVGIYGYQAPVLRRFAMLEPSPLEIEERLEQLRLLQNGFTIRVLETPKPHLGVDRPEDVARVEAELLEILRG
jgi:3-deoxy-manno-octulosonate cytidylyltransferase (CMP-KDO synthetase)